jgi:UDP-N-acetylmuramate--alanine ligase
MSKSVDFCGQPFHFIGIGGIGMSALAYVLAKRQIPVSGSDIRATHITQRLQSVGAHIFNAQDAANLEFFQARADRGEALNSRRQNYGMSEPTHAVPSQGTLIADAVRSPLPQVICSTAIQANNTEYQAAQARGCPIFHRSDVLAALIRDYQSIAVAGTHGKTTTSSLIGYMLVQAGLDPTIVVGGEVNALGGNARLGQSPILVAEADESDGSLAKLAPSIGIITNIELDHPDHYNTLDEVVATFKTFVEQCEIFIGCLDCEMVSSQFKPQISYSLDPQRGADYTATQIEYSAGGTTAQIWERGEVLGTLSLQLLGTHNLSNALAAIAVGRQLGLDFAALAAAIATFEGAKRRFELRGEGNGILFFDDYAHHPSELQATLAAARLRLKASQRLVAIFQPHRYSRTQAFLEDFAQSFQDADIVILTEIYSAGEADLGQVSGQKLADAVERLHDCTYYQPTLEAVTEFLPKILQPGDLALFLGAGNLNQIIPQLVEFYNRSV